MAQLIAVCSLDQAYIRAVITKQSAAKTRTNSGAELDYPVAGKREMICGAFCHWRQLLTSSSSPVGTN